MKLTKASANAFCMLASAVVLLAACNERNQQPEVSRIAQPSLCDGLNSQAEFAQVLGDGEITLARPEPEQPIAVRAEIVATKDGLVVVKDSSDNETFQYDARPGAQTGTLNRTVPRAPELDEGGRVSRLTAEERIQSEFHRLSVAEGEIIVPAKKSGEQARRIVINALTDGYLAAARILRIDNAYLYVVQEELPLGHGALQPRSFVTRRSLEADLHNGVEIPLTAELDSSRYVDIDQQGRVVYLNVAAQKVDVGVAEFGSKPFVPGPRPAIAPRARELEDFDFDAFEELVRSSAREFQVPPRTTRDQIVQRALAFLDATWLLKCENYTREALVSRCAQPDAHWLRPARLNGKFDSKVKGLPYKWGGYMSLEQFLARLEENHLAGDTCTCREKSAGYCIVPEAIGLDCSGFVSQAWGVSYHTTRRIPNISNEVAWEDLEPGDALNKPGSHVRLFLGFVGENELAFDVIESALACGGICRRTLGAAQMTGYTPVRPKHLE